MAYVPVNYENRRYMPGPLRRFATEAFEKVGVAPKHAAEIADYLVATDLRGVLSHGTIGIPGYIHSFRTAHYNPKPIIRVIREAGATIQFDGDGAIGHLVCARVTRGAVEKARALGVGVGSGIQCGHTGSVGNWTRIAASAGMIGIFNSTAISLPNLERPDMVSNAVNNPPISVGFPTPAGMPPVVLDMGTMLTPVAIHEQIAAIDTLPLIKSFAWQMVSVMMTLPIAAMQPRTLEAFPGAVCSLNMIALNPAFFGDINDYYTEVNRISEGLHRMQPMPGLDRTLLPGEIEAERVADFSRNGIPLDPEHIAQLGKLAQELDVPEYWKDA